jgi:hypothetical protein
MIPGRAPPVKREPALHVEHCVCGTGGTREFHRQRVEQLRDRIGAIARLLDCQSTVTMLVDHRCKVERCMALDLARRNVKAVA